MIINGTVTRRNMTTSRYKNIVFLFIRRTIVSSIYIEIRTSLLISLSVQKLR